MGTITSKFRNLYILKLIFGYFAAIVSIGICLKFLDGNYYPTKERAALIFIFVIILFVLGGTYEFLKITKIIVRNNAIEIQYFLGLRKRSIPYHEIVRINQHKTFLQGRTGQISDGFHLNEIVLADKSSFILSPDKFGNYPQLIVAIRRNLNNIPHNK
ncbi:hypothetical protein [Myroides fluvii]|uniref:hypothetical protein n=1 Tax=Myroides fluvii TaxID=2572594 RepID=UPI00131D394A|nr:hypothetical protein [Myroides fluvii]